MVGVVLYTEVSFGAQVYMAPKFTWHHMAPKFTWNHVSHDLVGVHEIFHEPCLEPWKRERRQC